MKQYNMFEENAVAATQGELFESSTALLLMTALEYLPPHPNPFNPHIGEFSERVYVLVCEKRRGYA